ncbi:formyltetrahydrofolate deformylase [Echinimonas agarilytica]|uniref:Formyltetrahydrofolate deformylase n=1 Tax=Echinimonas agarilytica TaxID=1215918 RepID=A0AA41W4F7_9GAMM|nr:formyltetrahydrofolate deformylase [Echinimonas agarilytica]MCM2678283.1 formyltetrahydrofolate deformylase [Echinimonas agarilytica]
MATQASEQVSAILLISCPDQKGLVHTVTQFIYTNGGNVIDIEQHVDRREGRFFMRVEWDLADFVIPRESLAGAFEKALATPLQMDWQLFYSDIKPRMAIFVSKHDHCLFDLLARYQSHEWDAEIPLVISNHPDLERSATNLGIKFVHIPVTKDNKAEAELQQRELLKQYNIDFIVLARYMQILSDDFIRSYPNQIINIHHSFLPAFPGARPYHSAYERGVKIIGATSHYVTAELDAGPIIEQDVEHVRHTDDVDDLVRKGRDVEKVVLSRAIWRHLNRQVLVYNNRTVVFGN